MLDLCFIPVRCKAAISGYSIIQLTGIINTSTGPFRSQLQLAICFLDPLTSTAELWTRLFGTGRGAIAYISVDPCHAVIHSALTFIRPVRACASPASTSQRSVVIQTSSMGTMPMRDVTYGRCYVRHPQVRSDFYSRLLHGTVA